ncbi:sodium/proton antiporter (CPA1 family) [Roseibium hamelinense]|uniref:Sodium/proton antiporter (CPA1 family) n=1 Tax=Roseibium hamelinense TaxID=150831 RepID=A0A562SXJ8_9HYPH|nr:sodium:proton antiporter [Roseibium hamelinense]MTI44826.1 sodium:proton antiporter [Roseibium hamelinense]TWI85981.1 sodium/proton antiporter (CPA1 family) [Roseibium hamelinense]
MATGLLMLATFTVCYTLLAKTLATTVFTAPILFLGLGYVLAMTGMMPVGEAEHLLHIVAELALIILLFLDAAQINLKALRRKFTWPLRMLVIGLPLSILFGTIAAIPFLAGLPLVAAMLVAAILAPTDAALGQAVVTNPLVPERVRRALTVESGLNDGLALPAILLFASLTAEMMDADATNWALFGAKQLIFGPIVGVFLGYVGGQLFLLAKARNMTSVTIEGIGAIAMAGGAYLAAGEVGGNGFIASFVAGLFFGNVVKGQCPFIYEFTESEGQMLTWGAFFLIGLALVPAAILHLNWQMLAIILVSLFVVRPLAIWISLIGSDAAPATRLFFGWFGPRGLATALFALVVVDQIDHELGETILMLAINAVWISSVLHGATAVPAAKWFGAYMARREEAPEAQPVPDMRKESFL